MAGVAVVGMFVAWFAMIIGYQSWLRNGVKPREFATQLSVEQVKQLFVQKVAHTGWKIIDDDNPMVAQSSMLSGIRQAISMQVTPHGDGLAVRIWVSRLSVKGLARVPYKAHTIRMRMNAFENVVARAGHAQAGARSRFDPVSSSHSVAATGPAPSIGLGWMNQATPVASAPIPTPQIAPAPHIPAPVLQVPPIPQMPPVPQMSAPVPQMPPVLQAPAPVAALTPPPYGTPAEDDAPWWAS